MIPSLVSKLGNAPVDPAGHAFIGPGAEKRYQPPAGVVEPHAPAPWLPSQQICGAAMPMKSEATPLRSVGAPVTQMFVLGWLPCTASLLHGLTCPPLLTWQYPPTGAELIVLPAPFEPLEPCLF